MISLNLMIMEQNDEKIDDCEHIMSMMRNNLMISHNNDEMMLIFLYKSTDLRDINGIELMILLIIHFYLENDDDRI